MGLSLETAQRLGHDFWISSEIHMNAVAMSANENIFLREESEKRNYDFGLGEGTKIFIVAAQPRLGSLRLEYVAYGLNSISAALGTYPSGRRPCLQSLPQGRILRFLFRRPRIDAFG